MDDCKASKTVCTLHKVTEILQRCPHKGIDIHGIKVYNIIVKWYGAAQIFLNVNAPFRGTYADDD
nr:MAG TPA: hypothetical protein [Caudoviricetes sp.]